MHLDHRGAVLVQKLHRPTGTLPSLEATFLAMAPEELAILCRLAAVLPQTNTFSPAGSDCPNGGR